MADQKHNPPSHEAQVNGGQQSHSVSSSNGEKAQGQQNGKGQHNQPSHEASVKGGQHSHSGSGNK
jgi:hypothetical protein